MSWNYRIIRNHQDDTVCNTDEDKYLYVVAEVYYDKNGKVDGWCERKDILEWCDLEDLEKTIELLQGVLGKPILEEKDNTLVEIKKGEPNNGKINKGNN